MTHSLTNYAQNQPSEPQTIAEGTCYYDLSQHSFAQAEQLYQKLSPFASLSFLMPDGRFLQSLFDAEAK